MILGNAQGFTEALVVDDLPGSEELDGFTDIRILDQAQNVVVGGAGFLFRSHTFVQICDDVSFYLKFTGIEGHTACCLRPDTNGVIHIIIGKSAFLDLFHGEVTGQLVNDGGNHFQMSKLFGSDIRQQSCHFLKGHGITLGQITHAGTHFPVGATVLGDDDLGQFGIGFLDIYREL